jgi:serpin B
MKVRVWIATVILVMVWLARLHAAAPATPSDTFAVNFYQQLAVQKGNLFLSPYSASCALAMAHEGARGKTADEIASALAISGGNFHEAFSPTRMHVSPPNELVVANALWVDKTFLIRPEFVRTLQEDFEAGFFSLDFRHQPEPARKQINDWVADKTKQRIQNLIPPGAIDPSTRVVLGNAIYFKGVWAMQFKKADTREQLFTTSDGEKIKVPLMENRVHAAGYFEQPGFQVLELAYTGDELSIVVLLPRDPTGLSALEKQLTPEHLDGWLTALQPEEVEAYLPRFKLETGFQLNQALQAMGIRLAFTDAADFSGMEEPGDQKLKVSAVFQKAFVEVNEEGTEAAAATGVVMHMEAIVRRAAPPVFRADHSFLFLIRDRRTNTILFMGRLVRGES